ncbi:RfaL Lipid A core - O-antigen ligase and related enzymes [Candidatus Nanopelagicaceae bacterium]
MLKSQYESTMAKLLFIGVPFTSLFLLTGTVTDPVNVTKFLALGGVGFAALSLFLIRGFKFGASISGTALILAGLFVIFSFISILMSDSPLPQNLYGLFGRNTGFLTYLFLVGLLLGALTLQKIDSFKKIYLGLFFTGVINVFYCGWVVFFGDFVGWNNPYGNILGLFGNPNFIGAFLGIWISATVGYLLGAAMPIWQRISIVLLLVLSLYEVYKSHAVQGVVVTAAGVATVGFFFIRSRTKGWVLVSLYSGTVISFGFVALAGALQKGPLAEIVYKTSVSLRGSYWNAGIQTALNHPLTGVGMDGYGDWYRRSRSLNAATVMPGPNTVTNSAHNVVIDIFSYGGFPLLLSYLGLLLLGAFAIFRGLKRTRTYDPIFVALSVAWIGYQLQSLISINQIGLAVWGWVLTGALIAYDASQKMDKSSLSDKTENKKTKPGAQNKSEVISSPLIAGLGLTVGLILACPPISADMAWVKAMKTGNFAEVEKVLQPSYLHPRSSERLANAAGILENSKLYDQAHKYALIATEFNPNNFEAWYILYAIKNSSENERALALENMKRLDPLNPDVTKR